MTAEPVTAAQLLENRAQLLLWISGKLDKPSCDFLWSVEDEQPDFGLIDLADVAALPGVGRKLQNLARRSKAKRQDRKSTRLNSSHVAISYAVFCLKKKN